MSPEIAPRQIPTTARAAPGIATAGTNTTVANSILSNNNVGLQNGGVTWLGRNVISGNATGVSVAGGTVNSYGDNYIRDNGTPGAPLTPVTTQ
jgi:hypothetical protein